LEENKENGIVIAEQDDKVDHLKPIKDTVESVGIEMPDMVAVGDLTVDKSDTMVIKNREEIAMVDDIDNKPKEVTKKDIPLPEIGEKFMLKGHEYKVIYINSGQHRFSCEPCKGVY